MSDYELKLQQDDTILEKVRNLIWDLKTMQPGFIIQLRVHQVIQQHDQNNQHLLATTNNKTETFLYKQKTLFETHNHMFHFLSDILSDQGLTVNANGIFLCDKGLLLLRHDTSRMLKFPKSVTLYTLTSLAQCVLRYVEWLSRNNRFRRFVPIVMDLKVVRRQRFQIRRVDYDDDVLGRIEDGQGCPICLDKLVVTGQLASRTSCAHLFHDHCIVRWLEKRRSCPLCRADLIQNR